MAEQWVSGGRTSEHLAGRKEEEEGEGKECRSGVAEVSVAATDATGDTFRPPRTQLRLAFVARQTAALLHSHLQVPRRDASLGEGGNKPDGSISPSEGRRGNPIRNLRLGVCELSFRDPGAPPPASVVLAPSVIALSGQDQAGQMAEALTWPYWGKLWMAL